MQDTRFARMLSVLGLCVTTAAWAAATSKPAASSQPAAARSSAGAVPGVGAIKGNNVIIRSGFSTNYYPVTKLNKGDPVHVAGEEFGWLKIDPPAGTFSLVDKNFVDKVSDKKGIINGSAQVYAGSNIDDRRYAKQVKLSKGAEVALLGETTDGAFCKIDPPAGAHLWVKSEFVERGQAAVSMVHGGDSQRTLASSGSAKLETVKPGELTETESRQTPVVKKTPRPQSAANKAKTATADAAVPPRPTASNELLEKYQMQINSIEAEIAAEGAKPLNERHFEPIITKLQPIADQTEDDLSQIYAKTRIDQLKGQVELAAAVRELKGLRSGAIADADDLAEARKKIEVGKHQPTDTIVVRGEIRASGIYDGLGNRPKRWRIVDTQGDDKAGKTIAYLEVPENGPIDPSQFYGKYVGIRAHAHKILKNTIPPVPIYEVREIVLNPSSEDRDDVLDTKAQSASPVPVVVTEPATQPSASGDDASDTPDEAKPAEGDAQPLQQ